MDLRQAIASGIQKQLVGGNIPLDKSEPIEELEGLDVALEATVTSALETQIRARTLNKGIRYFTVKVTEH